MGVPCISSPASSRTTVQPQALSRLPSHGFRAATPPTSRPADHGHGREARAPWRSVMARTRRMVLSPSLTLGVTGAKARSTAFRAGGRIDQLDVYHARASRVPARRISAEQVADVLAAAGDDPGPL